MEKQYREYYNWTGTHLNNAVEGFCNLVFSKSKGWKSTVENVPENDPAKKALRIGYCEKS